MQSTQAVSCWGTVLCQACFCLLTRARGSRCLRRNAWSSSSCVGRISRTSSSLPHAVSASGPAAAGSPHTPRAAGCPHTSHDQGQRTRGCDGVCSALCHSPRGSAPSALLNEEHLQSRYWHGGSMGQGHGATLVSPGLCACWDSRGRGQVQPGLWGVSQRRQMLP